MSSPQPKEHAMTERLFSFFLDEVLQRYLGPRLGSCPPIDIADLERLLTDDTGRRLGQARLAAAEWGGTERPGNAAITAECLLVTPRGMLYAARLSEAARGAPHRPVPRHLYYMATPPELFDPVTDRIGAARRLPVAAAAVDGRLGRDLVFTWPLDGALRRTLDTHEVLRLGRTGRHPVAA